MSRKLAFLCVLVVTVLAVATHLGWFHPRREPEPQPPRGTNRPRRGVVVDPSQPKALLKLHEAAGTDPLMDLAPADRPSLHGFPDYVSRLEREWKLTCAVAKDADENIIRSGVPHVMSLQWKVGSGGIDIWLRPFNTTREAQKCFLQNMMSLSVWVPERRTGYGWEQGSQRPGRSGTVFLRCGLVFAHINGSDRELGMRVAELLRAYLLPELHEGQTAVLVHTGAPRGLRPVVYEDEDCSFWNRDYGSGGRFTRGMFVFHKASGEWMQILKLATAAAKLGRSPSFEVCPLPVNWDYSSLKKSRFANMPLDGHSFVGLPDRVIQDVEAHTYLVQFNSRLAETTGRDAVLTQFVIDTREIDRAFDPGPVSEREKR